jgi:hypothetical protein
MNLAAHRVPGNRGAVSGCGRELLRRRVRRFAGTISLCANGLCRTWLSGFRISRYARFRNDVGGIDSGMAGLCEQFVKLDLDHPCWRDYSQLLQRLGLDAAIPDHMPAIADLNSLLDQQLLQKAGKLIRFVPAGQLPAVAYEEHVFRTGEISTRQDNWHDVFNALVWLRFPRIKAAMNASHFEEIRRGNTITRGPIRDALTLFDECGVIVVGDAEQPLQALAERDWKQLFGRHRSAWQRHLRVTVLGHALLERFLNPYKAITAQGMIFRTEPDFLQQPDELQIEQLDRLLASDIQAGLRLRSSAELSPLPLMGIPGWWSGTPQDDIFYADEVVFRPPPEGFRRAMISPLEISR